MQAEKNEDQTMSAQLEPAQEVAALDVEMQSQPTAEKPVEQAEKPAAVENVAEAATAITAENMPSDGVMLTSDYTHLQQMYAAQNMTRGIAPMPISTEEDMKNREPVIRPKTIYIPAYIFQEFTEVTVENEEFFSYISFYVVM